MRDIFHPSPIAQYVYLALVQEIDISPFTNGTYRIYDVTLTDERIDYRLSGRFEIREGCVTVLHDPAEQLAQHLAPGPITPAKRRYLASLLSASYKQVIWELEGLTYLPRYGVAVEPNQEAAEASTPQAPAP